MFGKFSTKDGAFIVAPDRVIIDGQTYIQPTNDMYISAGYYPVEITEKPSEMVDGYEYVSHFDIQDNRIVLVWDLVQISDDLTAEEILNILLGGDSE